MPSLSSPLPATIFPFPEITAWYPNWSSAASPSISDPIWIQELLKYLNTLAWPVSVPLAWLNLALAIIFKPLSDIETEVPNWSPAASPFIADPRRLHDEVPVGVNE